MDLALATMVTDRADALPADRPFTAAEARGLGVPRHLLRQLESTGVLRHVVRGVWAPADLPDDVGTRARALALVAPPDAVVVDRHAGWLHGAEMVLAPGEHLALRPLSLFRPAGHGRVRTAMTTSGERALRPSDVTTVEGIRVTTPLRTAWDLGRVRWADQALSGSDAMMRLGVFDRDDYLRGILRFARTRWVTTLRAVAPLVDGRSESPGESVLRLRCTESPLPPLEPQHVVRRDDGSIVARLDLGNEEHRLGVEYDGAEWHSSPDQLRHDRERREELADLGWLVAAYGKREVFGQHRIIDDALIALAARVAARR